MQFKTASEWKSYFENRPANEAAKLQVDLLDALTSNNATIGKANAQFADLDIVAGASDKVVFDAFAGKIPLAVVGVKPSGEVELVKNAAGYILTPANAHDNILLSGGGIGLVELVANFNLQLALTGVGSKMEWNNGVYSSVTLFYI
jgi:hypothetical protein